MDSCVSHGCTGVMGLRVGGGAPIHSFIAGRGGWCASPELVTLRGAPALGLSPGSGSYRPVITVTVFTELLLCLDGSLLNQQIGRGHGLDRQGRMSDRGRWEMWAGLSLWF